MRGLLALSSFIDGLNRRIGLAVSWLILIACIISVFNAISRKAFDLSSNAWLEIQWYLFGAIFLLAAGYTLLNNEHVRVDILSGKLSERGQIMIDTFGVLVFLLPVCAVVLWLSWPMVVESYRVHETSSNAGGLVRWPVKLLVPAGFALLIAAGISHLIKCIGFLQGRCPNPTRKAGEKTAEEALVEEIVQTARLAEDKEGR